MDCVPSSSVWSGYGYGYGAAAKAIEWKVATLTVDKPENKTQ
jgi:hypothetical protein